MQGTEFSSWASGTVQWDLRPGLRSWVLGEGLRCFLVMQTFSFWQASSSYSAGSGEAGQQASRKGGRVGPAIVAPVGRIAHLVTIVTSRIGPGRDFLGSNCAAIRSLGCMA
jgi:hypothetical protein